MRVLLWPSAYPPSIGGVERMAEGLANGLASAGHHVKVICPSDADTGLSHQHGVEVHRLAFYEALHTRRADLVVELRDAVRAIVESDPPDVVNVHGVHPALYFLRTCRALDDTPLVFSSHGWTAIPDRPGSVVESLLGRAARIVGCSRYATSLMRDRFPGAADRLLTIDNAVVPHSDAYPAVTAPPPAHGGGHIVTICRLVAGKGVEVLLRAMPLVHSAQPDARLSVVGDGAQRPELQGLVDSLGLTAHVDFVGSVPFADTTTWIDSSNVVVVPSTEPESFGLVAAEAAWRGRPVIASHIGALPEVVIDRDTGMLVAPGDHAALAAAIVETLRSPEQAARWGAAGRELARRRFGWERLLVDYENLYRIVVGSTSTPPDHRT